MFTFLAYLRWNRGKYTQTEVKRHRWTQHYSTCNSLTLLKTCQNSSTSKILESYLVILLKEDALCFRSHNEEWKKIYRNFAEARRNIFHFGGDSQVNLGVFLPSFIFWHQRHLALQRPILILSACSDLTSSLLLWCMSSWSFLSQWASGGAESRLPVACADRYCSIPTDSQVSRIFSNGVLRRHPRFRIWRTDGTFHYILENLGFVRE